METAGYRVGIDIGGTFTDFVLFNEQTSAIRLYKCLTTPADPSEGALSGLREVLAEEGIGIDRVREVVHGTTLVTNAVIERKGAPIGMLTTAGFRDTIEIATEQRYDIYDLQLVFPEPLVERARRLEVAERVAATGDVITPLDEEGARAAIRKLADGGVEGIAVCLMHAYRNPAHERRLRDLVAEEAPGLSVSISSEVVAEISEYQRFVTTCANAYVQPLMDRYLERFARELDAMGFAGSFRMMHSAGGLVSMDEARAFPIRLLESGPAGGARATAWFGAGAGTPDVIAFDMGGTTAKACLIENGRMHIASFLEAGRVHRFKNGSGLPIKSPVVDMIEIGAGGGSIARIDEVGLLRVGPDSAGAHPGPACYGKGGSEPTVTDASVALGYYDPTSLLGGRLNVDFEAGMRALRKVGGRLGLSEIETAWGIHKVVIESMASASQIHLVERGKDPRSYAMISFGGAGPAFAANVARVLNVAEVIIPPASGAASAFGFLTAPMSIETVRSLPQRMSRDMDGREINRVLRELEEEGRAKLRAAGVSDGGVEAARMADMQLVGQLHQISVRLPEGEIGRHSYDAIRSAFDEVYASRYTKVPVESEIEALSFRVVVSGPLPHMSVGGGAGGASRTGKPKGTRMAFFGSGFLEAQVYERDALAPGAVIAGPAIVEETESTTVVPPGDTLSVDDQGNLRIAVAVAKKREMLIAADTPVAEAVQILESDPVSLEIMWSRLVTVAEEMWHTVCRTAFSLIISESQDFACALLDAKGETLAHSARAMPAFNLALPNAVRSLLKHYPVETLKPGDVLVTNDPWLCAGHLFDIAMVTPVFRKGKVVAVLGTVGHVGDIGGTREGMKAKEIYEEGLQIPPMKFAREGVENEDLVRLMRENIRDPEQVLGDLRSLISANETGGNRILNLMDEYGLEDLNALALVVQARSEKAMRAAIRELPDGVYRSELWYNPNGTHMRLPIRAVVSGDSIEVDYDGSPRQLPQGGINCTLSYTTAHTTYPLKCMLTPNVRSNAGCYRPFTVKAPAGSVMNCNKPASVSMRTRTGWYASPNLFTAMADAIRDRVVAATGMPSLIYMHGTRADGTAFYDYLLSGGGQGACAAHDGKGSVLFPTSAATSSIELIESRSPVLVEEKALLEDSGGPGELRGGLGCRIRVRKRDDDGVTLSVILNPEGVEVPVNGLFGGGHGALPHGCVRDLSGNELWNVGTGGVIDLETTDRVVELQIAGGSGYGEPSDRSLAAIENDVRQGYVSGEAARRIYAYEGRAAQRKQANPARAGVQ